MTTRAPRARRAFAVAYPMPRAAPVIAMVLPLMLSMRPNFTRVKFGLEVLQRMTSAPRVLHEGCDCTPSAAVVQKSARELATWGYFQSPRANRRLWNAARRLALDS